MRPKNYLSVAALLGLLILASCKKSELDPPSPPDQLTQSCKLTKIDAGVDGANGRTFEYNQAGLITKMTLAFRQANTADAIRMNEYSFTYDGKNQLAEAKIIVDGQTPTEPIYYSIGDREKYVWTNGLLTQAIATIGGRPLATTSFTYDGQNRLVRAKTVPADPDGLPYESVYTYDAQGNYTCLSSSDGQKDLYEEFLIDASTKSGESLLPGHGLPYDVFSYTPWQTAVVKEYKSYTFDEAGRKVPDYNYKTTVREKNNQNVATGQQVESTTGKRTISFLLADCQ